MMWLYLSDWVGQLHIQVAICDILGCLVGVFDIEDTAATTNYKLHMDLLLHLLFMYALTSSPSLNNLTQKSKLYFSINSSLYQLLPPLTNFPLVPFILEWHVFSSGQLPCHFKRQNLLLCLMKPIWRSSIDSEEEILEQKSLKVFRQFAAISV